MKVDKHLEDSIKKSMELVDFCVKEKRYDTALLFCEEVKKFIAIKLEVVELQSLQQKTI